MCQNYHSVWRFCHSRKMTDKLYGSLSPSLLYDYWGRTKLSELVYPRVISSESDRVYFIPDEYLTRSNLILPSEADSITYGSLITPCKSLISQAVDIIYILGTCMPSLCHCVPVRAQARRDLCLSGCDHWVITPTGGWIPRPLKTAPVVPPLSYGCPAIGANPDG